MLPYVKITTDSPLYELVDRGDLGRLMVAMLDYARDGSEPAFDESLAKAWSSLKQVVDTQDRKYHSMCQRNQKNAASRYESLPVATSRSESLPVVDLENERKNEKESTKEKEINKEKEKEKRLSKDNLKKVQRFIPPTVDQVKAYCDERRNNVDANTFVDFYTMKDWMVGKNKMRDWRAAVRTWERSRNQMPRANKALSYKQSPISEADFNALLVDLDLS